MKEDLGTMTSALTEPHHGEQAHEQVKHTPGPWQAIPTSVRGQYLVQAGWDIPTTSFHDGTAFSHAFNEANAHLIAAAPEMLAALHASRIALINRDRSELDEAVYKAVCIVIAKAEGR